VPTPTPAHLTLANLLIAAQRTTESKKVIEAYLSHFPDDLTAIGLRQRLESTEGPNKKASIQITANGQVVSVTTTLSLEDLNRNGVAWCEPVKALTNASTSIFRLGTYLNIATICRENNRPIDEIGVLRRVAREFGREVGNVTSRIRELLQHDQILPELPVGWTIVSVDRDEQHFKSLAGIEGAIFANFWHPGAEFGGLLGTPGLDALPKNPALDNVSFHVCFNDAIVATVPVVINWKHTVGWVTNHAAADALPIEVHFTDATLCRSDAYKVVVIYLKDLLRRFGGRQFTIMESPGDNFTLYKTIIKRSRTYSAEVWNRPIVDLRVENERLFSGIRKSFKSSVNWCSKNLVVEYLTGDEITDEKARDVYNLIQDLHKDFIQKYGDGMTTELFMRPILMCRNQQGEVAITKTVDGVAYGVTISTYDGGVGYYALAGSRVLQGRNVGHFIVHNAILRAKARGLEKYVIDRFYEASLSLNGTQTKLMEDRLFNIIFFKRGYSDETEFVHVYNVLM
jgi:hypothetical protein